MSDPLEATLTQLPHQVTADESPSSAEIDGSRPLDSFEIRSGGFSLLKFQSWLFLQLCLTDTPIYFFQAHFLPMTTSPFALVSMAVLEIMPPCCLWDLYLLVLLSALLLQEVSPWIFLSSALYPFYHLPREDVIIIIILHQQASFFCNNYPT